MEIPYTIALMNFLWEYKITENSFLCGVFILLLVFGIIIFVLGRCTVSEKIPEIVEKPVEKIIYKEKELPLSDQYHDNMLELDNEHLLTNYKQLKNDYIKLQLEYTKLLPKSYDNMTYEELLKTPEWYVFRTVVLKTRGNICENCHQSYKGLNIHHTKYYACRNGKLFKPWEYSVNDMKVLCYDCHKQEHALHKIPTIYYKS